ncbi:YceI family protein [Mucilaginibacter paludis]|uniref:YceI family protein n=1 Tax=Mucilaginibacter paludis TaxID=423351 RepID=UPI0012FB9F44
MVFYISQVFSGNCRNAYRCFFKAYITLTAAKTFLSSESAQHDKHLVSSGFFDAETHPELKFVSTILKSGR